MKSKGIDMDEPFVTVVIFNRDGKRFLKKCIDSVLRQTYRNYELVLFDDCSSDGSVDFVKEHYPKIRIMQAESNIGIAAAQNRAYKTAQGRYIASLHNDTVADRDWLKRLVHAIESSNWNVACVEGGVYHFGGIGDLHGSLNIAGYNILGSTPPKEKFYSGTCSMIIKNGILRDYFDEEYFFYGEDVYLGWLLRLKGYNIIREPGSKVMHYGTVSASSDSIRKMYQFFSERNRLLNCLIFFEKKNVIKLLPVFLFTVFYKLISASFRNKWKIKPYMKAYYWILTHVNDISEKRAYLQHQRKVSDDDIIKRLSPKLAPYGLPFSNFINSVSALYCKIMGIETADSAKS